MLLDLLEGSFSIVRLAAGDPIPNWASGGDFVSMTRTADELSIVCESVRVPVGVRCERGWRCLGVAGPLDFAAVGILASLTKCLAGARVSIFAISTFDTDYILVREERVRAAVEALGADGHEVQLSPRQDT